MIVIPNEDVLFLILEALQNDSDSLYSCLLVNKTWCKTVVPVLWKNPWKYLRCRKMKSLLSVIISHLPNKTKEVLKIKGINLLITQQKPLFNYINFIKYLELNRLKEIMVSTKIMEVSKISFLRDVLLKLFIDSNVRLTHLYMPPLFDYQIHLIPGAEHCFSDLKLLDCSTGNIKQNVLEGLSRISKSIRKLEICANFDGDNSGAVKLIESQKNLNDVCFTSCWDTTDKSLPFRETLEKSLIKNAETIQCLRIGWEPVTNVLSHLVNLVKLEVKGVRKQNWNHLENVSLPALKILKAQCLPSKSLASLIANTSGQLNEISIDYGDNDNMEHIQAICQNCPNLKCFKLVFKYSNMSKLEELLINCRYLRGLVIELKNNCKVDWNNLFRILTNSSPTSLFKFKFYFSLYNTPGLESLKLFFDNWKGRHPMLLQTILVECDTTAKYFDLIEKYKMKGIVKKYDNHLYEFEDFEWIQKKLRFLY